MRLADLIRTQRVKRGMSKAELARQAGLSAGAITRLEKGEVIGRSDNVARIARALGIPSATLQAVLSEEDDREEIQLVNLAGVPTAQRARVRRAILDLVRNFEEEEAG